MDWALRSCSWRVHETYAPDEDALRARLHVDTAAGDAWRCLRCANFIPGSPRRSGPADHAPEVPHGRLLRDRWLMRILAIERLVRCVVLALVAYAVFKFRDHKGNVRDAFDTELPLLRPLASQIGWNIDDSKLVRWVERAFSLSPTTLLWIAVVATSLFLPLEIYELTEKVTVLRAGALLINVAAVAWLIWSKHLFGARGGVAVYHAEHSQESLLTVERAATSVAVR